MLEEVKKTLKFYATLDINKVLFEVYKDRGIQVRIIDLNRFDQLFDKGVNAKGKLIGTYKQAKTRSGSFSSPLRSVSASRKSIGDVYNFLDRGDLFGSMTFTPLSNGFELDTNEGIKIEFRSDVSDLIGLTDESIDELGNILIPKVNEWILNQR